MSSFSQDYSGIEINCDYTANESVIFSDASTIAQQFVLPSNYVRGTTAIEQRLPSISGLQFLVNTGTNADIAQWEWQIGYSLATTPTSLGQFTFVESGTTIGATQTLSGNVWFDIFFDQPITVTKQMLDAYWLMVLTPTNIVSASYFAFTEVNGFDKRLQGFTINNAITNPSLAPLSPAGCFNFRLLTLSADDGIDFLGNQYRSVVVTAPAINISSSGASLGGIGNYYLSPALPAPDAVASLYFDMRPMATELQYGLTNYVLNPSFEYDSIGAAPGNWSQQVGAATLGSFEVVDATTPYGVQVLDFSATNVASNASIQVTSALMPITGGTAYTAAAAIQFNSATTATSFYALTQINWYGANTNTPLATTASAQQVSSQTNFVQSPVSGVAPALATSMSVSVILYNADSVSANLGAYIDGVIAVSGNVINTSGVNEILPSENLYPSLSLYPSYEGTSVIYFDGNSLDPYAVWTGAPGASTSTEILNANTLINNGTPVVIDALILDPLFANQTYTLYYSNDDTGNQNLSNAAPSNTPNWENKLWTPALLSVTNYGNEIHVLAQPIAAKYLKIELSNPQVQSYDPGPFQLPITYHTFPSWVQNYFLSQTQYPAYNSQQVVVQNDALSTLYTPYINDLIQSPVVPNTPIAANYNVLSNNNALDITTLAQINTTINPYQDPLGSQADPSTTLGAIASAQINQGPTGSQQVIETVAPSPTPITTVSSLQRDSVLAELFSPDMYFYLTCRHAYMQKSATLTNNKAYFFGINQVTFLRSQSTVASDTSLYTENGRDAANASLNDFVINAQGWWDTYVAS